MRGDGSARDDVLQPTGDVGISIEAEHRGHLRERIRERAAVTIGQAADRDHGATYLRRPQQGINRVLLRRCHETTRVHHDNVDVAIVTGDPPPFGAELAGELLRVDLVARATERDERSGGRRSGGWWHVRRVPVVGVPSTSSRPITWPAVTCEDIVTVRRARTPDVSAIKSLVDIYAGSGRKLLAKELVALYEDVPDFRVAERGGVVIGCGALHVLWADLGEIRTLAVHPDHRGHGYGDLLVDELMATARDLGLARLFALTFHTGFFARHGFTEIEGTPVDPDTYDALRRSYDPGVAEFLALEYVKPNTLGNTRMIRYL